MRPLALVALALVCGCASTPRRKKDPPACEADGRSGPDGKRSGAQLLLPNRAHTDEVSCANQDKTDWYAVTLRGKAGFLDTLIHWDTDTSDVMIDVFDEFGKQLSASPVRGKGEKEKKLITQIDHPGLYYLRVTAPFRTDGTVYTVEARWDAPPEPPPVPIGPPVELDEPEHRHHVTPREPREPRERGSETVEGRIVTAYRDGGALTLHLDKGSAAGLKVGMTGTVLSGPSGQDPLEGGEFRILSVLDGNKSVARTQAHSIGKNTRVLINLGR